MTPILLVLSLLALAAMTVHTIMRWDRLTKAHKALYLLAGLVLLDYDVYTVVNLADLCHAISCIAEQKKA